jgi:hypothetical protein
VTLARIPAIQIQVKDLMSFMVAYAQENMFSPGANPWAEVI